ncbi:non-specific lipid-transfer protein [Phtheirospermum japonicum]|uniref:Non-specific lipid-transfer protein n=1 Tax=Phtheirospermum japonicum TaxID=374723 RepID=A0A830CEV2_9LAMI|nr:non-specific lipid-transfer protein [Phtheirospermum japonicum]
MDHYVGTVGRLTACGCLKTTANRSKPKLELAKSLPGKCGVSLSFEVSLSVDCSK